MIDIAMWTFNGSKTLPAVLKRINEVLPKEVVHNRICVDDHSQDDTREIAKQYGWQVVFNSGKGISDGANTVLGLVKTDWFASFEQDLLLSSDWWPTVSKYIGQLSIGAVSGMRFASQPKGVTALQKYVAKKYRGEKQLAVYLRGREAQSFTLGKTLDNTLYQTEAVHATGGFPKILTNAGVDTVLAYQLQKYGYDWIVDYNCQSVHLRRGLHDELKHQYSYGLQINHIRKAVKELASSNFPLSRKGVLARLVISPFTGVWVAYHTGVFSVCYVHPLVRLAYTCGVLKDAF